MPALRVWLGTLVVVPALARAQPAEDAARLFDEGRALVEAGDYADACAKFDASFALDHAIGTELNLADCDEHIGHFRAAWDLFSAAITELDKTGDRRTLFAHERLAALEPKLGTIVVRIAEPRGLTVTIDGKPVAAAAEIEERVDPGDHEIRVRSPDHPELVRSAHASAGATSVVDVLPFETRPPAPPPPPPVYVRRKSRVHAAWIIGGAAVVTGATGLVIGLVGRSDYHQELDNGDCRAEAGHLRCTTVGIDAINHAGTLEDVATGFGIAALAIASASAIVYVTAPRERVVTPYITTSGAGVAMTGAF